MPEQYIINESDRRLIQEALDKLRKRQFGAEGRPAVPQQLPQSPEVYIARTPTGGIGGLSAALGTAGGENDTAYFADCRIYQLEFDGLTAALHSTGEAVTVFNISPDEVPEDSWCIIARDKYGAWWIVQVVTTPGKCDPVVHYETDLRCENGKLNLYERQVEIAVDDAAGCLIRTAKPYLLVRAVACCDDSCADDAAKWYCIEFPDAYTGTATASGGCDCSDIQCYAALPSMGDELLALGGSLVNSASPEPSGFGFDPGQVWPVVTEIEFSAYLPTGTGTVDGKVDVWVRTDCCLRAGVMVELEYSDPDWSVSLVSVLNRAVLATATFTGPVDGSDGLMSVSDSGVAITVTITVDDVVVQTVSTATAESAGSFQAVGLSGGDAVVVTSLVVMGGGSPTWIDYFDEDDATYASAHMPDFGCVAPITGTASGSVLDDPILDICSDCAAGTLPRFYTFTLPDDMDSFNDVTCTDATCLAIGGTHVLDFYFPTDLVISSVNCIWGKDVGVHCNDIFDVDGAFHNILLLLPKSSPGAPGYLSILVGTDGGNEIHTTITYQTLGAWDCNGPNVMTKQSGDSVCNGLPDTITVYNV